MAALTLFIKTHESLTRVGSEPQALLHFPGDLGPLASDGILHGLELLQELLPPRQRAGSPGLGPGVWGLAGHTGDLAGALGLRRHLVLPAGVGRPSGARGHPAGGLQLLALGRTLTLCWVRLRSADSGVALRAWDPAGPVPACEDQGCAGRTAWP